MKLQCEKSSSGSEDKQAHQHALIQPSLTKFDENLAKFDKNKEKLLQRLIDGRKQGARRTVFDTTESWAILRRTAESYLLNEEMRKSARSNAQTANDLAKLERNLSAAHALLEKNDVVVNLMTDVFSARYTKKGKVVLKADLSKIQAELTQAASHVRKLEMTASRAATKARSKPGRPTGRPNSGSTMLPSYHIVGLAKLFRDATGRVPGAGEGPFGFFLVEFLNAVGGSLASRSVFNLIISARKKSLAEDANSPFRQNSTH
jgi:hypothetical protein